MQDIIADLYKNLVVWKKPYKIWSGGEKDKHKPGETHKIAILKVNHFSYITAAG